MKTTKIIHLLTVLFLITLTACVGKIEEASVPNTTQFVTDPILFSYNGIATANAVSHDKIEITFQKVDGPVNDYTYKLYINDSEIGTEILLSSLSSHLGGRYYFLVTNLNINSSYKFRVRAFNKKTGAQSKDEASLQAKTFDNVVSDFRGIINLVNVPGQESRAIRVKWDKVPYFVASPTKPNDPIRYEIIYSMGSPAELFNPQSQFRWIKTIPQIAVANHPTELDVDELEPNTTYYFTVRSVHRIYGTYENSGSSYIPVDRENNTKFLSLKTAEGEGVPGFNPANFNVKNALGMAGYSDVGATWARSWGSFYAMKIIYKKDTTDFVENDFVSIPLKSNDADSGILTITDPFATKKEIVGLTTGSVYQFKLLLCKTPLAECTISGIGPNVADRSNTKSIQIKPSLASFMGITSISHPNNPTSLNEVTINFDPPVTSVGWADGMKFYCVGDNNTQHELSQTTPLSHADGGVCNGLTRGIIPPEISTLTNLKVYGTLLNGTEYCFTATPYIYNVMGPISAQLNDGQRIKRCITPQILTPTIKQFTGAETIAVDTNVRRLTVTWNQPSGGVYDRYVVFWKKRPETATISTFNFNTAVGEYQSTYSSNFGVRETSCGVTNYCFKTITSGNTHPTPAGLETGIHDIGVLTLITSMSGATTNFFWSQINLKVKNAEILPSKADFQGWTRIFAIGPKRSNVKMDDTSSLGTIIEALNSSGVPYEASEPVVPEFFQPPGQPLAVDPDTDTINLGAAFDGKKRANGHGSNSGIVSLAWEDVDFDYNSDNTTFSSPTNQNDTLRTNSSRKFGYKVYRSDDNRITWRDLTLNEAILIHSRNFTYRKRPNIGNGQATTTRMAFFTDYSVESRPSVESSNHLINGTEQARVYWYKIVPYFNGKPVTLNKPELAVVRVTLPPPNMALVHRWMANRSQCLELNLTPNIEKNYSCVYTGVGAVQDQFPFEQGNTSLDLKADLLVDRYELGCNYTRGPETIALQTNLETTQWNSFSNVYSAIAQKGCYRFVEPGHTVGSLNPLPGLLSSVDTPPTVESDLKGQLLIGDCIGESSDTYNPRSHCDDAILLRGGYTAEDYSLPGFSPKNSELLLPTVCNTFYPEKRVGVNVGGDFTGFNPPYFTNSDRFSWLKKFAAQSNFLNVYHNTYENVSGTIPNPLVGVSGSTPTILSTTPTERVTPLAASCSINLAAIDGANGIDYIPRWANLNRLTGSYDESISLDKSPSEIRSNNKLYGGGVFTAPPMPSYIPNVPIGRIMTTNNAGAPPVTGVDRNVASKVCELYKVDVVVYSGGTSYLAKNLSKRLLRKREFIASNMWPERYGMGEVDFLEGVNSEYEETSEELFNNGSRCAHDPIGVGNLERWSSLPPRLPGNPYFSGTTETSNCISRYGIQDMVGNVEEPSNEILFCGYSPLSLRFGATGSDETWQNHFTMSGESPEYQPNGGSTDEPHVDLSYVTPSYSGTNWLLLRKGMKGGNPEYFKIKKHDDTVVPNGVFDNENVFKPYIKDQVGAGYCSMVDQDVDRRNNELERSILWTQDIFGDLFFKTLNQQLIKTHANVKDKGSLRYYRDGEGYFLDFGPYSMSNPILNRDSLSFPWRFTGTGTELTTEIKKGLTSDDEFIDNVFFSPLLGIPLSCGVGPSYSGRCPRNQEAVVMEKNSYDSFLAEYPEIDDQFPGGIDNPHPNIISDYYVGGSKIENEGLREVPNSPLTPQSAPAPSIDPGGANPNGNFRVITGVKLGEGLSAQNPIHLSGNLAGLNQITTIDEPLSNFDPGTQVSYWNVSWQLPRNTELYFSQGGHFNKGDDASDRKNHHNGRFSTRIGRYYGRESGIRCGVAIHEVD